MIKIEKKIIKNKPFFYLSEQIKVDDKFKKIQVYIGKNIPNDLAIYYDGLKRKEADLIINHFEKWSFPPGSISKPEMVKAELRRLDFKYGYSLMSEFQKSLFWRNFAIKFIFESNAIEGSKLSQDEVEAIVKKRRLSSKLDRKEVREVENSIKVFEIIQSGEFRLNQRTVIELHKTLVDGLDIPFGYKKEEIFVNNKATVAVGEVRNKMAGLLEWWKKAQKGNENPLLVAAEFHSRFEYIHPFTDGNGRTGRLLFNWMLIKSGYGPILFKNKNRRAYFSALDQADEGRLKKLHRHCLEVYAKTIEELFD